MAFVMNFQVPPTGGETYVGKVEITSAEIKFPSKAASDTLASAIKDISTRDFEGIDISRALNDNMKSFPSAEVSRVSSPQITNAKMPNNERTI